jgi:hypothetical protein
MPGILRIFCILLAAAGWMVGGPAAVQAQTRPVVTSLGPDFPKTTIFIGNSFFYYNNGMPGHVSLLEQAADPDHQQDYRATMVTIGGSGFDWHDVTRACQAARTQSLCGRQAPSESGRNLSRSLHRVRRAHRPLAGRQ